MLDKVKLALRITHTMLDSDIQDTINTARSEMVRAGVSEELANSDINLVQQAIKTFCQWQYCNDEKKTDGFFVSWQYQLENLRKATIALAPEEGMEG